MSEAKQSPLFSTRLVLGLAVIALGIILTLDNLRWYDAWGLLNYWPLVLAAFGVARLIQDGPLSGRGHVWLALSVAGAISQFGPWGLLERWWPIFLVWWGIVVSLRALLQPTPPRTTKDLPAPEPSHSCDPGTESNSRQS